MIKETAWCNTMQGMYLKTDHSVFFTNHKFQTNRTCQHFYEFPQQQSKDRKEPILSAEISAGLITALINI